MKKLILGTLVACTGTMGYSQMRMMEHQSIGQSKAENAELTQGIPSSMKAATTPTTSAPGAVIFEETFGNGLNGDGSNGAWSVSGSPSTALWEYRGAATTPDLTTGSRGAYATNLGPIQSATTANGFFIFDSDYLDNGGTAGNFGQGAAAAPHTGYLESPSFDLSSYPNVVIELSSYYRRFQSNCAIEFSVDGGSSWGFSIPLYGDENSINEINVNDATATNDVTSTYIAAGVGGNANVKMRFVFDGTPGNANGNGYYFWMVDDIKISEAPQNDLSASKMYFNFPDTLTIDYTYALVPELQAPKDSMVLGIVVENKGSVAQPNVFAGATIAGPTTTNLVSTSSLSSIAVNATDSLGLPLYLPTAGIGAYNISVFTTSDSTPDITIDDTLKYVYNVTADQYAWATDVSNNYQPSGATSSYEVCSHFQINEADKAKEISVEFYHNANDANDAANLIAGTDFLGFRIITDNEFDNNSAYTGSNIAEYNVCNNTFYSVQTADLGNVITVPVTHDAATPTLTPGGYYVCVKSYNTAVFMASDDSRSQDNWHSGTTISDTDDGNSWAGLRVTPTITLTTQNGVDPCASVNLTATFDHQHPSVDNESLTATVAGGTAPYCYSWVYPDNTTTADGQTITGITQAGTYTLNVTDALGCSNSITTDITTSIEEVSFATELKLYPNPNRGQFTLELANLTENVSISVKNVVGQVVFTGNMNAGSINKVISLNNAEAGIYFIDVKSTSGEIATFKMIVE